MRPLLHYALRLHSAMMLSREGYDLPPTKSGYRLVVALETPVKAEEDNGRSVQTLCSPRHHFIYTSAESRRLCWVGLRPER
jgi:hypothetical protein